MGEELYQVISEAVMEGEEEEGKARIFVKDDFLFYWGCRSCPFLATFCFDLSSPS